MAREFTSLISLSTSRLLRSFVFTILAITSPFFLTQEGLGAFEIGLVIALSGGISTVFVYYFPRLGMSVRGILLLAWILLVLSLLILVVEQSALAYVVALLVGGIPLSGKDMSPNQALEQYSIGKNARDQREKNTFFGYYNFLSYAGNTIASTLLLLDGEIGFREIFILSLAVAALSGIPYFFYRFPKYEKKPAGSTLSREIRGLRNELAALFSLDSFAGGLINSSMLSLWFLVVYSTTLTETGFIFVVVNVLSAVSVLISGKITTSIGMVRTMVYTHLVSNGFLVMMAVFHSLLFSEIMLFARQTTSQMDVPPRDSFINTVIPERDRMRTNSQFIAARNASIIPSPAAGGALVEILPASIPALAGGLKALYDAVFFARFHSYHD